MPLIHHFRPATPNIGNDLIVFALQELIAQAATRPYDLINMPAKGVSAVIKTGGITRQVVNDINQLGCGVLIGPGNLFENNGLEIDPIALEALQIPPLIFSVSWGRIFDDRGDLHPRTDAMSGEMIATLCRKSSAVLVRDARTRDHLHSLGIDRAQVIGCPVLSLQPERLALPAPDPRAQDAVIISVRNPLLMNVSPRLQGRVHRDIQHLIEKLRSMGHEKIALLCHDARDIRFAAAYPEVPVLYTENTQKYLSWLRDCRLSITFRLHSFLPCAVFGTPSVHFSYDERAIGLIETAHLQACDVNYVRDSDPVAQALAMAAEPDRLRAAVEAARPGWRGLDNLMRAELSRWLAGLSK